MFRYFSVELYSVHDRHQCHCIKILYVATNYRAHNKLHKIKKKKLACIRIMIATSATASTGPSCLDLMYAVSEPHNSCEVDAMEESLPVLGW
jgi:hypothetical protein